MGGLKRKIPMEKIEKKDSRAVAFSKRRMGLYGKASELCLLSGAKMAILATPVSSKSNVSFYSFGGNSSVDSVVSAFLTNQRPPENLGLGFWWEDESLLNSENLVELRDTLDSMSTLINDLKELRSNAEKNQDDLEKKKDVSHQTLNFESTSAINDDYLPVNFEGFVQNTEEQILEICENDNNNTGLLGSLDGSLAIHRDLDDGNLHLSDMDEEQILGISDNNNNGLPEDFGGCKEELYVDQNFVIETTSEVLTMNLEMNDVSMVTTNQNPLAEDRALMMMNRDLDQNQAFSDNNNNNSNSSSTNLDEFDLDKIFDFETKYEGLTMKLKMDDASTSQNPCSDSETIEDRALVIMHTDLDEDNLHFSDFFQ